MSAARMTDSDLSALLRRNVKALMEHGDTWAMLSEETGLGYRTCQLYSGSSALTITKVAGAFGVPPGSLFDGPAERPDPLAVTVTLSAEDMRDLKRAAARNSKTAAGQAKFAVEAFLRSYGSATDVQGVVQISPDFKRYLDGRGHRLSEYLEAPTVEVRGDWADMGIKWEATGDDDDWLIGLASEAEAGREADAKGATP